MRFGMKNKFARLILAPAATLLFLCSNPAQAQDLPLLTWEKGKIQSVVLGGGDTTIDWQVFLQSQDNKVLELNGSASNSNGFLVYRVTVPREIQTGAYSIVTSGEGKPPTQVAAVQIIEMQRYAITQVPGDLLFFLVALAFWFTSAGALRGQKFRKVTLLLSTGPKERYLFGEPSQEFIEHVHRFAPFEKVRIRISEQLPDSFFKYLLKSDSRGTHLNFPWLWAQLPLFALLVAAILAYSSDQIIGQPLSNQSLVLLLILVFIGSIDIYSGILAAFAYFAVDIWLLSDFSLSAVFGSIIEALLIFSPSLLIAFFSIITLQKSHISSGKPLYKIIFEWLSPAMTVHFLFVLSRSISGSVESTAALEIFIVSTLFIGRIVNSYLTGHFTTPSSKSAVVEEVEVVLGRLISPLFALIFALFLSLLFYLWIGKGWPAIALGGFICLPLFLLLIRPTLSALKFLSRLKRHPLVEIAVVLLLVYLATEAFFLLPIITELSPTLFISLSMAPVIFYSIIVYLLDLGVKADREKESS
jgi:hypothetical protein